MLLSDQLKQLVELHKAAELAMKDTGRMVPAIKGDRTRRPWVELWGDWLHRVDVP